jgi:hypothetical protein
VSPGGAGPDEPRPHEGTDNAFSPTNAPPLTGRAKPAMQTQAPIFFTIITLALARVVGSFG